MTYFDTSKKASTYHKSTYKTCGKCGVSWEITAPKYAIRSDREGVVIGFEGDDGSKESFFTATSRQPIDSKNPDDIITIELKKFESTEVD